MINKDFFGALEQVTVVDQESSKYLGSSESVIGSRVNLEFGTDPNGTTQVKVFSKRGYPLGAFSAGFSEKLTQQNDAGRTCVAFVSAIGFAEDEGMYWGEFTVIAYPSEQETIWNVFTETLAKKIAAGKHPDVNLSPKATRLVIESNGAWCDMKSAPYLKLDHNNVYIKKRRTPKDELIEKAVSGNKGCQISAILFWIILFAIIAALVWWLFFK